MKDHHVLVCVFTLPVQREACSCCHVQQKLELEEAACFKASGSTVAVCNVRNEKALRLERGECCPALCVCVHVCVC